MRQGGEGEGGGRGGRGREREIMCVSGRRIPLRSHFDSSTMPRGRVACWKASNPSETGRELAKVLEPHVEAIVRLGERIYLSASFNQKDIHPGALGNQARS